MNLVFLRLVCKARNTNLIHLEVGSRLLESLGVTYKPLFRFNVLGTMCLDIIKSLLFLVRY